MKEDSWLYAPAEAADWYARWLKHKASCSEITIAQVAVERTWVERQQLTMGFQTQMKSNILRTLLANKSAIETVHEMFKQLVQDEESKGLSKAENPSSRPSKTESFFNQLQ